MKKVTTVTSTKDITSGTGDGRTGRIMGPETSFSDDQVI